VQTLMHVHGNGQGGGDAAAGDVAPVDLDVLAATEQDGARADVA
jgi:hypothetical protein